MSNLSYGDEKFLVRWKSKSETFMDKEKAIEYQKKHEGSRLHRWNPYAGKWEQVDVK